MCCLQLCRKMVTDKSPRCRKQMVQGIRNCRRASSLSRLKAAKSTLLNLKAELSHEPSPDLKTTVQHAIDQLAATSPNDTRTFYPTTLQDSGFST